MKYMKKLKLLLVAPVPPPYGGIANWVVLMKKYLSDKEEVELVDIVNIAPKQRGLDGRTLYDRIIEQGLQMLQLRSQIKEIIQEKKPTVVHITTSGQLAIIRDIFFLKLLKQKKIRSVYHIHFGRIAEIAERNTFEWKLLKRALRLATVVIAIDQKTQSIFEKQLLMNKSILVANPFITKDVEKHTNTTTSKTIMFLGWCVKTKGIEELLSAWIDIESNYSDWQLKIVGPYDQDYKEKLVKKYTSNSIIFEGEKEHEEALDILSKSGIFILPSYTEGFPNAVLEAMALRKPIIATDVGAISDMLSEECGIVIRPRDAEVVKKALIKLLDDEQLRKKLGDNAYYRVRKHYDIDVIYKKYLSIWRGEEAL